MATLSGIGRVLVVRLVRIWGRGAFRGSAHLGGEAHLEIQAAFVHGHSLKGATGSIKSEIITRVSRDAGLNRGQSIRAVKALVSSIRDALKAGEKISLSGLGTFKIKARKGRTATILKTALPS